MADNEEKEEPAARGNEWEVVSLTGSTYAAAPSSDQVNVTDDENSNTDVENEAAETSRALFMSGHFVFPPSQHENLPLEAEHNEIRSAQGNEDAGYQSFGDEGIQSETKEQAMMNTKGSTVPDAFPGIQIFDENGNILPVGGTEYEEGPAFQGLNLVDKEQSVYNSEPFSSFHSERMIGRAANVDEGTEITEIEEPYDYGLDSDLPKPTDEEYDASNLPCGAWWKRRAASLYAHAKEANTFWSIFIAAAVMGLVILGQQWQQERWQVLQLKWQFSVNNERMSRVMGSLTRFKDVIVGGQRRGSLIRASTSTEH